MMYTITVRRPLVSNVGWDAPETAQTLEQLLALLSEPGMVLTIERTD
jgi:hypothetical protein